MKKIIAFFAMLTMLGDVANAQHIVINPIAAEQSHADLNINKIVFYADSTIVELTVENKLDKGGWFCADRDIYLENPSTNERYQLTNSLGIPTCPTTYSFTRKGEKLHFKLIFPSLPNDLKFLNLIENCNNACFSFKGIILDQKLNDDIQTYNRAMEYYKSNNFDKAIEFFEKVIESIPQNPTHVYGYSYYHLVIINLNKKDSKTADYWLNQLENSTLPDKQYFIDEISKQRRITE